MFVYDVRTKYRLSFREAVMVAGAAAADERGH
jgi:hypothetical protein